MRVKRPTRRAFLRAIAGASSVPWLLRGSRAVPAPITRASAPQGVAKLGHFDVCVVGSGPAGAILAVSLAERGVRTLLVEGGPSGLPRPEYAAGEYPLEWTRSQQVGGTSNLWSGGCSRLLPSDLDLPKPYRPEGAAWPFSYEEIEPFLARAEEELEVSGEAPSIFSAPRTAAYPVDPERRLRGTAIDEFLRRRGVVVDLPPMSRGGGVRVALTHLPRFLRQPSGRFVIGTKVTRINTEGTRVRSLSVRADGARAEIEAERFVLACGGIETPRLLLASHSSEFPEGIGNHNGLVGRYFMEHRSVALATGIVAGAELAGAGSVEALSWQFYERLKNEGLGGAVFEVFLQAGDSRWQVDWSSPIETLARWMRGAPAKVSLATVFEMEPRPENRVLLVDSPNESQEPGARVEVSLSPRDLRTLDRTREIAGAVLADMDAADITLLEGHGGWCHHHMGTCRMGTDRATSVVDENLRVRGTSNLYVSGSAPFVTAGAASPTLTLTALALRLSDHLVAAG